ncbi:MAG: efflux RND transporter periplasmic adaptor subunit [Spirochaetales bacterium]|nr:efflux RND transporter periplasmic adaptor subunit [Spirochaetales bacterium]
MEVFADIAGKVVTLPVSLGDSVRKEQVIAKVDPSKPGKEYAESPVLAPISGTVTALPIRVGSTITSSTPIATIGQLNALRIETHIPERFISKVQVGTPASFTFAAWPGESFSGRVVELSPVVDSASRTLKATLVLDSQDGGVRAGMYATVQLVTERRHAVLRIPAECVVRRNGQGAQDVVFVLQDNRAVQRPVRIGISSGGMVEITAGIESGEEVVVSGQSLLSDGAAVKIIDDEQTGGGA